MSRPHRRQVVRSLALGSVFFPTVLADLLAAERPASGLAGGGAGGPLAPRPGHFPAKAKRVIFVFATGGVSHIDTFDPKPMAGQDGSGKDKLMSCVFPIGRNPRTGTQVTDLFPHLREKLDEICLIRSMASAHFDHSEAALGLHTGSATFARPSMGSWLSYGLGTVNRDLPSFIVIAPHLPYGGTQVYASDFLPAVHQGTRVIPGPVPIDNLAPRSRSARVQELELAFGRALDDGHAAARPLDGELSARIKAMETAFTMQTAGPEAFDLTGETAETLDLYGLDAGQTTGFGWQCLVARRLAERGVRFIELVDSGSRPNWDAHSHMDEHKAMAKSVDRPLAALITDLRRRGLLDETLIVWATEFGRTPEKEGKLGRGHHGKAFSIWLAGGGIRGGHVHGATDDRGEEITEGRVDVHDLHATILHLLGLDHERLTFYHNGIDRRLTDVHGEVVRKILA